jgi:hypothetical protein
LRKRIDKWTKIKPKSSCTAKETVTRLRRKPTWRELFLIPVTTEPNWAYLGATGDGERTNV